MLWDAATSEAAGQTLGGCGKHDVLLSLGCTAPASAPHCCGAQCLQTFNLLTLRRPWEAGKVVLSSFYSGETQTISIQIQSKLAAEARCAASLILPRTVGSSPPPLLSGLLLMSFRSLCHNHP